MRCELCLEAAGDIRASNGMPSINIWRGKVQAVLVRAHVLIGFSVSAAHTTHSVIFLKESGTCC